MEINLKECPFCGADAAFAIVRGFRYPHGVKCTNQDCGAFLAGTSYENNEFNAKLWNKRSRQRSEP